MTDAKNYLELWSTTWRNIQYNCLFLFPFNPPSDQTLHFKLLSTWGLRSCSSWTDKQSSLAFNVLKIILDHLSSTNRNSAKILDKLFNFAVWSCKISIADIFILISLELCRTWDLVPLVSKTVSASVSWTSSSAELNYLPLSADCLSRRGTCYSLIWISPLPPPTVSLCWIR